jgi:hypothetical protein
MAAVKGHQLPFLVDHLPAQHLPGGAAHIYEEELATIVGHIRRANHGILLICPLVFSALIDYFGSGYSWLRIVSIRSVPIGSFAKGIRFVVRI